MCTASQVLLIFFFFAVLTSDLDKLFCQKICGSDEIKWKQQKKSHQALDKGNIYLQAAEKHEVMEIPLTAAMHSHAANSSICPECRVRGQ